MAENEQPLVAIAVPVYNSIKYFRECLEHIQGQTYSNWKCFITDNASTDGTYELALEFAEKDSRFQVFRNPETTTPWENFNIAYSHLKGCGAKYAKAEPSDDWMFPECIEEMVKELEKSDEIGGCFAYALHGTKIDYDCLDIYQGPVYDGKELLHNYLTKGDYMVGCLGTPIYRMEALLKLNSDLHIYNELNIHCDVELANDILKDWKVAFVFKPLTYYRVHGEQGAAFAVRFGTDYYGHEVEYVKHSDLFNDTSVAYHQHRIDYAKFYLLQQYRHNTDCVQWHDYYLGHILNRPLVKNEKKEACIQEIKRYRHDLFISFVKLIRSIILFRYVFVNPKREISYLYSDKSLGGKRQSK